MSNFRIEDAVNVVKEIMGIAYDASQEIRFAFDNREALRSKNFMSISNRLETTKERYKFPITTISVIVEIAENVVQQQPLQKKPFRMQECKYCPLYNQQESSECVKCHTLTHHTDRIPIYTVMQKAGEKGTDWGIDWLLNHFNDNERARIKAEFYARQNRQY